MKTIKFLMMALMMCFTIVSFGQEKFTKYKNMYNGKNYNIEISVVDTNDFSLYINMMSLDLTHEKGGIVIEREQIGELLTALNSAKIKYNEWVKVAKEKNVTSLDKSMDIFSNTSGFPVIVGSFFQYGRDWHFQHTVKLSFDFKILSKDNTLKYLLIVRTGKLTASDNQFMEVDGFVFVFESTREIDDFTNLISRDNITSFIKKPKQGDLFK